MSRKLAILLGACVAVVCAFVNFLARKSAEELTDVVSKPVVISCQQLLDQWPDDTYHIQLVEFQRGKEVVARDFDGDSSWDLVYVPLFPNALRKVGNNYSSVIVHFDDVPNDAALNKRLEQGQLESQLWFSEQELPTDIHSEMARKHVLMDFSKCVVLQGGFRPPSPILGKSLIFGSCIGLIAASIFMIWNLIAMMIPQRKPMDLHIEQPQRTSNRAGLPDF